MSRILDQLHSDHVNVARLLDYIEQQLSHLDDGEPINAAMMYVVMHYMTHYPDIFHHPREDKVFAVLRKQDESIVPVLDKLQAEHVELAELGEELLSLFEAKRDGEPVNDDYVVQATRNYLELHRSHMDMEESRVFPMARILLSEVELGKVDQQVKLREDPLFGEVTETVYSVLLRALETS